MSYRPSRREILRGSAVGAGVVALAACTSEPGEQAPSTTGAGPVGASSSPTAVGFGPEPVTLAGLTALAHVEGTTLRLHTASGDVTFWVGARLSGHVPGTEAGELAGTAAHYRRWFAQMREFGARFVVLDRLHPAAAYSELVRHNTTYADDPLYVMQIVTLPVRESSSDLFRDETDRMRSLVRQHVSAVHGDGTDGYSADVSPWVAAWTIDINWGAARIDQSDTANRRAGRHEGQYVRSHEDASPTENWLAARLDELATQLAQRSVTVPLAVVNRPETDVLRHPRHSPSASPSESGTGSQSASSTSPGTSTASGVPSGEASTAEAGADLRPGQIAATSEWPGGIFSYYDAPPYRPEFIATDPVFGATSDPYLTYLGELRSSMGIPLLIGSFGVTSALGSGYPGTAERSQGDHNESEKFAIEANLVDVLARDGFAGGMLAHWHDDWSASTWNTASRARVAGRTKRPIIDHDPLTADQWGGVVALDPTRQGQRVVHEAPEDGMQRVLIDHDASWLYLTLEFDGRITSPVEVGFNMFNDGGVRLPGGSGEPIHDVALRTVPTMSTTYLMIRAILDPLQLDGVPLPVIPSSGHMGWHMQRLLRSTSNTEEAIADWNARTSRESGRERRERLTRLRYLDVGDLKLGSFDPKASDYDSRATWNMSRESGSSPAVLQYRLPWGLLGMLDPAHRRALDFDGGEPRMVPMRAMTVTVESSTPGSPIDFAMPLPAWSVARYSERVKTGASRLSEAFRKAEEPVERNTASPTPVEPGASNTEVTSTPATPSGSVSPSSTE